MAGYLLGEMSEEERARFEEEFAGDRDLIEELVDVENDLVDSYATGRLTEAERRAFESDYLATPMRRARAELAKSLINRLSSLTPAVSIPGGQEWDGELFTHHGNAASWRSYIPTMRIAALVMLGLGLAGGLGILVWSDQRLRHELAKVQAEHVNLRRDETALRQEVARLTRQAQETAAGDTQGAAIPRASAAEVALLTLSSGLVRSGDREDKLMILRGMTRVRLQLKLGQRPYETYDASLETAEGIRIWQKRSLRSERTPEHGRVVLVELPASTLHNGDYILKLGGITATGQEAAVDAYAFRAVRQ